MNKLARVIVEQAELAARGFYRLVVVAGQAGSGKTRALRQLRSEQGWSLLNLNKDLSERLLELTSQQRRLRTAELLRDLLAARGEQTVCMLDNIGLLFHPSLHQEPLRVLQRASRNRTVIAAWQGEVSGGKLIYASPDHPEYRRLDVKDVQIVTSEGHSMAEA